LKIHCEKRGELKMKKLIYLTLALVMFSTMLAGCATTGTAPAPTSAPVATAVPAPAKTTVNIAIGENLFDLNPLNTSSLPARIVAFNVFEPLIESDHKGTSGVFTPDLATKWEHDASGKVWTFTLRQGVKFHNGEDFTSADVVATYQRLLKAGNTLAVYSQFWSYLSEVKAVDPFTVQIITKEPFASTLISVAFTPILSAKALAALGDTAWDKKYMYGTGPWIFDEWVDGSYTHFTKNDNYWNKANYNSAFKDMFIKYILEPSSAVAAQLSKGVDAYVPSNGINGELIALYKGTEKTTQLITMKTGTFNYFGFNCATGAFADQNARLAFDYAIDRATIAKTIFGGMANVPSSVVLDVTPGFDPKFANYTYDPKVAKDYLAKSNYDGHEITLYSSTGLSKSEDQLLAVSEMLNAVGFKTKVSILEGAAFSTLRTSAKYEVFLINDMTVGGDLAKYLSQKILNDTHKSGYKNPEMMTLVNNILTELDPAKRAAYLTQYAVMSRSVAAPHSMLAQFTATYAVNYGLTGIDLWTDGTFGFKYVSYDPKLVK
jgi:ABC-type transport system substrate-binding protein